MKQIIKLKRFWGIFILPRVIIYLLIGIAIIFLTFFTSNNAAEIAISAIGSIFIGIAVNNFTAVETTQNDIKEFASKIEFSKEMKNLINDKLGKIYNNIGSVSNYQLKEELEELHRLINLSSNVLTAQNDN
jgi:hypothetical protein